MKTKNTLPYEQAAELQTVSGWVCKTCNHFYGTNEHAARYCCCDGMTCECGKLMDKGYIKCVDCRTKGDIERHEKRPVAEWDGKQMIYDDASDRYFSDLDEVVDHYASEDREIRDARLVLCVPHNPPYFELISYVSDYLPEDVECPGDIAEASAVELVVNDWINKHSPFSWMPGKFRLDTEKLAQQLNIQDKASDLSLEEGA